MAGELRPIIDVILAEYALPLDGDHGVAHWARVLENGRRLSGATGADLKVVSLFAVFHDARRLNEFTDPEHGLRGAGLAASVRGELLDLRDAEFELLYAACAGHTHEATHPDVTVRTCWDADRLDLGRVGVTPDPARLCTDAAREREMIAWADGRAEFGVVPEFVGAEWGVTLP